MNTSPKKDIICVVCGSYITHTAVAPDPCVCSKECLDLYQTDAETNATILAVQEGSTNPLTPADSAAMRGSLATIVASHLATAHEVLQGKRTWSANQVNLFGKMLNKVVPDLNASYIAHEHNSKKLQQLSRDELEALAGGDTSKIKRIQANARKQPPKARP